MKIDHIVMNIDEKYQTDLAIIENVRNAGLPYEPKKGKSTAGFKASNIWIGDEYFEMINILKPTGGGWVPEWTSRYNKGHRGMICLMLDVDDLDEVYRTMLKKEIELSKPTWLQFKFLFNLFSKKLPWRNSYLPFFDKVPFQIGFQQLKNSDTRNNMRKCMLPNSKENGIKKILEIEIFGDFSNEDFTMLKKVFANSKETNNGVDILLDSNQKLSFVKADNYTVIVKTDSDTKNSTIIENLTINC